MSHYQEIKFMTSYQKKSLASEIAGDEISVGTLAYFRGRYMNRIHALVLEKYVELEAKKEINKASLARRIRKEPAQITRWLGNPGNWTTETYSDLMLGMGYEPMVGADSIKLASNPSGT